MSAKKILKKLRERSARAGVFGKKDAVNHPDHYTSVKGVECIDVTKNFNFCLGNAIKYIWRCNHKGKKIEDLKKAIWYIEKEIVETVKQQTEADNVVIDEDLIISKGNF